MDILLHVGSAPDRHDSFQHLFGGHSACDRGAWHPASWGSGQTAGGFLRGLFLRRAACGPDPNSGKTGAVSLLMGEAASLVANQLLISETKTDRGLHVIRCAGGAAFACDCANGCTVSVPALARARGRRFWCWPIRLNRHSGGPLAGYTGGARRASGTRWDQLDGSPMIRRAAADVINDLACASARSERSPFARYANFAATPNFIFRNSPTGRACPFSDTGFW